MKISAVAYGDEDHIIRRRGNVSVKRTSFDWIVGAVGAPLSSEGLKVFPEDFPAVFFGNFPVGLT